MQKEELIEIAEVLHEVKKTFEKNNTIGGISTEEMLLMDITERVLEIIHIKTSEKKTEEMKRKKERIKNLSIECERNDKGEVAAVIILEVSEKEIYVDAMLTIPKERRKGIMKKMLSRIIEENKSKSFSMIPVSNASKQLADSFNFFEILDHKDGIWYLEN